MHHLQRDSTLLLPHLSEIQFFCKKVTTEVPCNKSPEYLNTYHPNHSQQTLHFYLKATHLRIRAEIVERVVTVFLLGSQTLPWPFGIWLQQRHLCPTHNQERTSNNILLTFLTSSLIQTSHPCPQQYVSRQPSPRRKKK